MRAALAGGADAAAGSRRPRLLGRPERVDMASAALINGITSHTFDFDDTHLKTIIHPAGPVASALPRAGRARTVRRAARTSLIDALVLGIDVSCRMGNAMYPDHYDRGWHITGSTGTLGAAAACARLLGLDTQQDRDGAGHRGVATQWGVREQFGTMTKPFHPGGAHARGLTVGAALAKPGLHRQPEARSRRRAASRRWCRPSSTPREIDATDALGERFEISFNTYKPFACGIVIHPSIDACGAAARAQGVRAENRSSASSSRCTPWCSN